MGLKQFIESRTGLPSLLKKFLYEKVKGGGRWSYVFGSCLVVLFAVQFITGIVLAFHYSPSTTQAWGSIAYLQENLRTGWFIRGLHHWGASFVVILAIVHLFQVFSFGAYKSPREFNWWSGVFLFFLTLGMALTGYLLPWDQRGYWSSRVVTNIIGTIPIVGSKLSHILMGGSDFGNLTLTHFYGLHALILPILFSIFVLFHIFLFRRHGVTEAWWRHDLDLETNTEPFWPRQVFKDLLVSLLILIILAGWVIYKKGAPLGPPADPTSNYLARPEWYFLFLYESLKFFKGKWEVVGTLVLPTFLLLFLLALPLVDRHPKRHPKVRKRFFIIGGLFTAFLLAFTIIPLIQDHDDPVFQHLRAEGKREAKIALNLAEGGIPPGGPLAMLEEDPVENGHRLFSANCVTCHTLHQLGGQLGPDLTGYLSPTWLEGFLKNPQGKGYYGGTKLGGMPPVQLPEPQIKQLVSYISSLSQASPSPAAQAGFQVFQQNCQMCHGIPGSEPGLALDLTGYGSREWLKSFLKNPAQDKFYGEASQMPGFQNILSDKELDDVVQFLLSLKSEKTE
jgi:quinol-cytochrome oxidoreductase complex cytochrome b subunit/cytochrome c2